MSPPPNNHSHADGDQAEPVTRESARARKPYVKPAFVREEVFEATALACGKVNPTIRQCNLVRKNS
jgi:hypothetical protein